MSDPAPTDRELLDQAAKALRDCAKAALVVEPTLKQPYPDDPRWSPWTRWVEGPARTAHDLSMAIRKQLRSTPPLREKLAALASEMQEEARLIAPHSSAPDEMPDMADQIRAEVLGETAGRILAAMEG